MRLHKAPGAACGLCLLLISSLTTLLSLASQAAFASGPQVTHRPTNPRYELRLTQNEFSVLHSAAQSGIAKYGGAADFRVRIEKDSTGVSWLVSVDDPRLMDVWGYWLSEKTAELVRILDVDRVDDQMKSALRTTKSLNDKFDHARANPTWDPTRVLGTVKILNGTAFVFFGSDSIRATGQRSVELRDFDGKTVTVTGPIRTEGVIEVTHLAPVNPNTLELCVMSLCPFAQKAEAELIAFLREGSTELVKPTVVPRYIFYKTQRASGPVYSSLHGEAEIGEDLVQIVIREDFPALLHEYLWRRSTDDRPWQEIARQIGMVPDTVKHIERRITSDRDMLIQREYETVAGTYSVYDGSPTYVWEGQRVPNLGEVKAFERLGATEGTCADKRSP